MDGDHDNGSSSVGVFSVNLFSFFLLSPSRSVVLLLFSVCSKWGRWGRLEAPCQCLKFNGGLFVPSID